MDDVRAVMDAAGVERAVVVGVSEGGPMCALFAATHPDRTLALVTMGAYARRNWAPDYPIGRRPEQDGWLRPTAEQWGRFAAERFLTERAPSVAADERAIEWYTSYIARGASPSAVAAITDMNEEIDVRPVLASVRVPSLVIHREHEYLRDASRYMGERLPGARVAELPGDDHLPWEGDQAAVLDEIERFLGALGDAPAQPGAVLTTVLEADLPASEQRLLDSALARFRGRVLDAPPGPHPRGLRRPGARRALRDRARRQLPAAARRHPHRRVRAAQRHGQRPRAGRRRRGRPGRRARGDPRDLDGAGPRRGLRASSSPTTAGRRRAAAVQRAALTAALSGSSRGCGRRRRSGARR